MSIKSLAFVLFGCALFLASCNNPPSQSSNVSLPSDDVNQNSEMTKPSEPAFQPLFVYLDRGSKENHFVPSGFMPDGTCLKFEDNWGENCQEGKTCIRIIYDVECSRETQRWAGIYWLNPANNWGQRKGGFNLTGAQRLVFWARGEQGGEQIQEVTVGGITGDYPDSDKTVMGPIILTPEWREYTVDLRGKDLTYISGGFAWSTSEDVNGETCVFYLDNIRFE